MIDLAILNGVVVVADGSAQPLDLGIDNGKVVEISPHGGGSRAREAIDASGLHVLPGVVDAHFHCRAPSHPERGTFGTETRAAAAGGVTTVLEMPISNPACSTPEVFEARRRLGERDCYVDFGLYSGAALPTPTAAEEMMELGAVAFKLFTHRAPEGREAEFYGLCAPTEEEIHRALSVLSRTGLPCTVHAEDQGLIDHYEQSVESDTPRRPPDVETRAIEQLGKISKETGTSVHVAHMSSADSVDALLAAKKIASITGETCPHYLIFTEEQTNTFGSMVKVAPPLRTTNDNRRLLDAVRTGAIEIVASDHAPFTPQDKDVPFRDAPRGIPGIEFMLPVMLDLFESAQIPLSEVVRALAEAPARRFGLYPRKGVIAEGSDADLVMWDSRKRTQLRLESFFSRSGGSAVVYDGMKLRGSIRRTIVSGKTVFIDGEVVGEPTGRFVRPEGVSTRA